MWWTIYLFIYSQFYLFQFHHNNNDDDDNEDDYNNNNNNWISEFTGIGIQKLLFYFKIDLRFCNFLTIYLL